MIRSRVIAFLLTLGVLAFVALDKTQGQDKQSTPAANPAPSAPTEGIADLFSALAAAVPRGANIGPDSSINDLLPVPPKPRPINPALLEKLNQVPEAEFQARMAKNSGASTMRQSISHLIERINHLNKDKPDHFVEALRDNRADLKGLPFAMGKACRIQGQRALHFETAVRTTPAPPRWRFKRAWLADRLAVIPSPIQQERKGVTGPNLAIARLISRQQQHGGVLKA